MGYERIEETEDPELAFDRAMETYLKKGYSKEWINQRLKSIEVRKGCPGHENLRVGWQVASARALADRRKKCAIDYG